MAARQGLTLDSGAIIAFERYDRRIHVHLENARRRGRDITVPTIVITETWRGKNPRLSNFFASVIIEDLTDQIARIAGEALGQVSGAKAIDAIVIASAAQRGDTLLTGDWHDMRRLQDYFPSVRLLAL